MTAILKVDTIQDTAGNNIINENANTVTIGKAGDTVALAGSSVTGITQGITEMDMFRLTASITSDSDITSNLERVDTFNFSKIGTGMTESSGVFSFPSTGVYEVTIQARVSNAGAGIDDRIQINTKISTDGGSNYSTIDGCDNAVNGSGGGASATFQQTNFINVTTSNFRVRFTAASLSSGSSVTGDTTHNRTAFIFKRLGDSQ